MTSYPRKDVGLSTGLQRRNEMSNKGFEQYSTTLYTYWDSVFDWLRNSSYSCRLIWGSKIDPKDLKVFIVPVVGIARAARYVFVERRKDYVIEKLNILKL